MGDSAAILRAKAPTSFKPEGGGSLHPDQSGHLGSIGSCSPTPASRRKVVATAGALLRRPHRSPPTPARLDAPAEHHATTSQLLLHLCPLRKRLLGLGGESTGPRRLRYHHPGGQLKSAAAKFWRGKQRRAKGARDLHGGMKCSTTRNFSRKKLKRAARRKSSKPSETPEDVWTQKSGNRSDEWPCFYVALARRAGLKSGHAGVDRSRAIFDQRYSASASLTIHRRHRYAGKEIYLALDKRCAPRLLHWKHALATGIRLNRKAPMRRQPRQPHSVQR